MGTISNGEDCKYTNLYLIRIEFFLRTKNHFIPTPRDSSTVLLAPLHYHTGKLGHIHANAQAGIKMLVDRFPSPVAELAVQKR